MLPLFLGEKTAETFGLVAPANLGKAVLLGARAWVRVAVVSCSARIFLRFAAGTAAAAVCATVGMM